MFALNLRAADVFDPRGRADRRGLAVIAAGIVGAHCVLSYYPQLSGQDVPWGVSVLAQLVMAWAGLAAISKRLHDFGYGLTHFALAVLCILIGCMCTAFGLVVIFGEDVLVAGGIAYMAIAAWVFIPAVFTSMWFHAMEGDLSANRFGPAPGERGFSHPRDVVQSQLAA